MTDERKQPTSQKQETDETTQIETEKLRQMTFEDRLAEFNRIMALAEHQPQAPRNDDDHISQNWIKIYERYEASLRSKR